MAEALTALAGLATIVQMAISAGLKAKSHKHNVQALVRRLKLVPPLIEEVRASRAPLTESQLNVFENLELAMQRAKDLLTKCSENSKLYMIFRGDSIVQKFRDVGLDLDRCLSALSFVQLKVSDGTLEKIEEVRVALREAKFKVDVVDQNLSLKIAEALKEQRDAQRVNEELLRSLATQLDLTTVQASRAEEKGLLRDREEARLEKERGEEAYINQIIHLLDTLELKEASGDKASAKRVPASPPQPPDEFRCPVSLELMADPVILDSGHTFERAYIQKWLNDGHRTCPISRKPLTTLKLIPNQTLKGMIITWCERNHVALPKLPVLKMKPTNALAPTGDVGRSVLEGFKGLRFNSDHSGSSAEWEEYEMTTGRGAKKRRGVSKYEEELQRFGGHRNGLAEPVLKPPRRGSKAEELVRGVGSFSQQLVLCNVETEESGGDAIAEGLAFGAPAAGQGLGFGAAPECAPTSNPNSGQLSEGFSALGNLYDSGSLKFDGPDAYSDFDIRDVMCESPLHAQSLPERPGDDVSGGFDDVSISRLPGFDDASASPAARFEDVSFPSVGGFEDVSISGGAGLLGFEPGDRCFGGASTSEPGSLLEEPKFMLSWERQSPERDAEFASETLVNEPQAASRRGPRNTAGLRLVGLQEAGYQPSRLRLAERETSMGGPRNVEDVLRTMDGGEYSREKRSLPAEFQHGVSPDPSTRHGHREDMRPLARGGPGGRRSSVNGRVGFGNGGRVRGDPEGDLPGLWCLDEGLDSGSGGLAGRKTGFTLGGVGVSEVSVNGVGVNGVGGMGSGVNTGRMKRGIPANSDTWHGVEAGAIGLNGVEVNRDDVKRIDMNGGDVKRIDTNGGAVKRVESMKGGGVNGNRAHGEGRGGGNGRHKTALPADGTAANPKRREGTAKPLTLRHYEWESNGIGLSSFPDNLNPAPPPKTSPKSPVGNGVGISRRSSDPAKHEGRLEGMAAHRRGASLPKEPAGRSPPLRSPRSPAFAPILDDFLLDAPAQVGVRTPHEFGHRVTAPQPDVRNPSQNAPTAERPVPAEKPKPYLTTPEEVHGLLQALEGDDIATKRDAAEMLRALGKNSNANRATIAAAGAIPLLLNLIDSPDGKLQEHAITAILNLSIHDVNKTALAVAGAIPALVEVLANPWSSAGAKESAAATLFSLSVMDDCKVTIGDAGAIPHLVDLLRNGSARGQKDAVTALFNLSIFSGNKVRIIKAKAVPLLIALVRDHSVREKCVAVLANLSTMKDGRAKIAEAGGIPVLVDQVEVGTPRSKENAAATLLQLGVNSSRYTAAMIQAGAISPLLALSQNGTPRAKEKAVGLIRQFREQRRTESARAHVGEQMGVSL